MTAGLRDGIACDIDENLRQRVEFHQACELGAKAREHAIYLFMRDIIAFFDLCLFTYDPRESPSDIPFIAYKFQEEYIQKVNQHIIDAESLLTEKSRDMGVTWQILGVFLYRFLLFDEDFLVGSRKEDLVDTIGNINTLFERLRYMIKTMPQWIVEYCRFDIRDSGYMKIYKQGGAAITGESMNANFSRQGRYKAILLDEFAFCENAEPVWMGTGDSSPCKIVVSTPYGNTNKFARLRKSGQIEISTLHWKLHPNKDGVWYAKECAKRTEQAIAQELDINYNVSAGKPFYNGFKRALHSGKFNVNTQKPLMLGFDYGYHHPTCIVSQIDAKGRWVILDVLFGEDQIIKIFGQDVLRFLNVNFTNMEIDCWGDPAGDQVSDKSEKTSVQILKELGIKVKSTPSNTPETNYRARKEIIEGKLSTIIDGIPALVINDIPRTQILIEGFEGGYHYPEANKWGFVKEEPLKEGYHEHAFNAMEYIAVNIFKIRKPSVALKSKKRRRYYEIVETRNGGFSFE